MRRRCSSTAESAPEKEESSEEGESHILYIHSHDKRLYHSLYAIILIIAIIPLQESIVLLKFKVRAIRRFGGGCDLAAAGLSDGCYKVHGVFRDSPQNHCWANFRHFLHLHYRLRLPEHFEAARFAQKSSLKKIIVTTLLITNKIEQSSY